VESRKEEKCLYSKAKHHRIIIRDKCSMWTQNAIENI